ncbi:karyopherin beta [Ascoidea rubescens DSM 1968]|uniref:Importin-95 n=1 Tax=Ascoidea rubescens DSM 1968 TaxID=1344418 RepID=A0A1D2VJG7_9ASCO|nr:importin beta-1 subunit [Ascoidea rubescens DSM 1968]ODV61710.1 importin beta-1 subunit [Ascoidea rubescens DSM 1968]
MDIGQVLENAILNPNPQERFQAEQQLENAAKENFPLYLSLLSEALNNESKKTEVRMLASLALKNQLISKDPKQHKIYSERWINLDNNFKNQIKANSLKNLLSSDDRVANSAAQLVAAIAEIDLSRNDWPELINSLIENTKPEVPDHIKRSNLLTIGYICESADPNNAGIVSRANDFLIAIIQGAQSSEKNSKIVRLTAINALVDSLEFIQSNFQKEGERNYIMQVVCEATQASDVDLQAAAFGALAKIMSLYYKFMPLYMERALYSLTISGMQNTDEKVSCMAVEFWSTVCEEELEISYRREDFNNSNSSSLIPDDNPDFTSYNFSLIAIEDVLPTLLSLLKKQNDDLDDDTWNISMAAGACLQLFAQNCGTPVVKPTLDFVERNINSTEWRSREASVMAFGSILDGPDHSQLKFLIAQALNSILELIDDENLQVKETVAWCLGRIADLVIDAIDTEQHLPSVINAIVKGLQVHPKVSRNCCWTLMNLIEQLNQDSSNTESTPMSKYYSSLVPVLLQVSGRGDNEYTSRASAYEALSALVLFSSKDVMPLVNSIASEALNRLNITIEMSQQPDKLSLNDLSNLQELQSNILSLLSNVIRRAGKDVLSVSDSLMEMFLKLLSIQQNQRNSLIEEDVFIAISTTASAVESEFIKYMDSFLPFLNNALENTESQICNTAVGLVADISRSLGDQIIPYCNGLMNTLGNNLSNPDIRRELRPAILSCFGDIATSIGEAFQPYLDVVMKICSAAQNLQPEDSSVETLEYIIDVKEAVLDAYVGVVAGLEKQPQYLRPYVDIIFQFLVSIPTDFNFSSSDTVCRAACGLIGDLAEIFSKDNQIQQALRSPWVATFLRQVKLNQSFSVTTRNTAKWAKKKIQ